jgi:hypothetical protein
MIPVGPETLGRIINVIGDPIDERGPVPTDKRQVRPFKDLFVTAFPVLCIQILTFFSQGDPDPNFR